MRVLGLGGLDFDDVTRFELGRQGNEATVDLGTDAPRSTIGVDAVREVDRRRLGREGDHVTSRGEAKTSS